MQNFPPPSAATIRAAFENVRACILPLVQRWRMRRVGDEVQQLFESLAAALARNPDGGEEVIEAACVLGALLEQRAPSAARAVDPALGALYELHAALTGDMPIIGTNLAEMTPEERAEFQEVMAAEAARQAAGLPPSDTDGHDCAICALLARQRARRAS